MSELLTPMAPVILPALPFFLALTGLVARAYLWPSRPREPVLCALCRNAGYLQCPGAHRGQCTKCQRRMDNLAHRVCNTCSSDFDLCGLCGEKAHSKGRKNTYR